MENRNIEFKNLIYDLLGAKFFLITLVTFALTTVICQSHKCLIEPVLFGTILIAFQIVFSFICYITRRKAKYFQFVLCLRLFVIMIGSLPLLTIYINGFDWVLYLIFCICWIATFCLNIRIEQKDWENKFRFLTSSGKINLKRNIFYLSQNTLYARKENKNSKFLIIGNFFVPLISLILYRLLFVGGPVLELTIIKFCALVWVLAMDYAFAVNIYMLYKIIEYEKKQNCVFVTEFQKKRKG